MLTYAGTLTHAGTRRQLMRFRQRNFLAAKLQSVYRGHIARLDVLVLRRFNAANKLQVLSLYSSHTKIKNKK
jgi:hypothetical protein